MCKVCLQGGLTDYVFMLQRVDCTNRQCNYTQETTNSESCQKCHDLEKCFNKVVRIFKSGGFFARTHYFKPNPQVLLRNSFCLSLESNTESLIASQKNGKYFNVWTNALRRVLCSVHTKCSTFSCSFVQDCVTSKYHQCFTPWQ